MLWSEPGYIPRCTLRLGLRDGLVLVLLLGGLLGYLTLHRLRLLWLFLFGLGRGPRFSVALVATSLARTLFATSRHNEYRHR